ncbi:uncharacterized protein LOC122624695 [Drosophila teissieri]|uniref:uncharacterized protein LOC122624695 n=1 Tax=Drosophila teissieri TaxID=7243 RepID=UPI001CBA4101|nr:uncharacterized protein LOC122624695 [Drosophila teissieri]
MANILRTEEGKITEIVEKLVEQNSKRYANDDDDDGDDEPFNMPRCSRDIFLSCPELSGMQDIFDYSPLVPRAGSAHTYRTAQLLTIGRRVADRMVDPSGQREMSCSRYLLDERLRSAGIYHNRLGCCPYGLFCESEKGARGDTDPGKPNTSMGSMA